MASMRLLINSFDTSISPKYPPFGLKRWSWGSAVLQSCGFRCMPQFTYDGFVKSPTSALRCILRHCSVL